MKTIALAAAVAALATLAPAAHAQTAPAEAAAAAKFNLDTPIETIAADEAGKAVLDANMPGLLTHPSYEYFKGMSLRQLQPMSEGKITDEGLAQTEAALAAIKDAE